MNIINFKKYVKKNNFFDISLIPDDEIQFKLSINEFNKFIEKNHFIGYPEKFKFTHRIFISYILYLSENNDDYRQEINFLKELKILRVDAGNKIFEINSAYDYCCATNIVFNDLSFYMISKSLILDVIKILDPTSEITFNLKEISNFINDYKSKIDNEALNKIFLNNIYNQKMIINIFMCPDYLLSLKQKELNKIMQLNSESQNFIHLLYSSKDALRYVLNEFDFHLYTNRYIKSIFKAITFNDNIDFEKQYYVINTINSKSDKNNSILRAEKNRKMTIWNSLFLSFIDDINYTKSDINENQFIAIKHYLQSYKFKHCNSYIKNLIIDKLSKKINKLNLINEIKLNDLIFLLLFNNQDKLSESSTLENYLLKKNIKSKTEFLFFIYNVCNKNQLFLQNLYSDKYFKTKKINFNVDLINSENDDNIHSLAKIRDLLNNKDSEKYLDLYSLNEQIDNLIKNKLNADNIITKVKKRI